jgi:hypothetical protein
MIGPEKLPHWLRKAYLRAINWTCEDCGIKEGEKYKDGETARIEIHRIIEGHKGGTYVMHNVKGLCDRCHKMRAEEW